ncbi:Pyruvate synthase subunit PorB [Phycisphaerae bacterium RAS1]|nr:Pyruvate synthase subunit PorB [Phycisphaerae bacterium RAS1]
MTAATLEPKSKKSGASARQTVWIGNGNEAVARAILDIGYDAEGYYPITPSSEAGENVQKAFASGETDISFIVGTSELAAISICAGAAIAGGRAVDVTSAQGLLLKAEQMPAISGLGLPMVLNLSTREISAPLNIKNGHSDLYAALGYGWLIFMAPTVQATYDMNIIAIKVAEAVNLPAIVAYDGFHTSHANRRVMVFADREDVQRFVGPPPFKGTLEGKNGRLSFIDVKHPHTFGPYMNDDVINSKVQMEQKFQRAYELLPRIFDEFAALTGRRYDFVHQYGDKSADRCLIALNTAGEAAKDAVDLLEARNEAVNLIVPMVLRPWPERELLDALGAAQRIVVAERGSQYGASNYLANEIGAALQRQGNSARVIQRSYGIGGLNFTREDALEMYAEASSELRVASSELKKGASGSEQASIAQSELATRYSELATPPSRPSFGFAPSKLYHGAWPGDPDYSPPQTLTPLTVEQCTLNAGKDGKVNLKELMNMPQRFDKHTACPGCGIFTNLNDFLRGIDGHVCLIFNTGCGMVVTTGYPLTSFKVPYFHNLFHNGTSTATGVVEMIKRFQRKGELPEEITVIVVSGDGGDDIGMDQVIGSALRNDPFILLEYDNKGYMNTGAQLCYTGYKGQKNSNAAIGPKQAGKTNHHKDIVEILRGTFAPYLATVSEAHSVDMIRKARKAQAAVRAGGFAFVKAMSVCPLNWGMADHGGRAVVEAAVNACLHPLFEVVHGVTALSLNPEKQGKKIPVVEAFKMMGSAFSHLATPEYAALAQEIQAEVDRRWARLVAMAENPVL